MPEKACSAAANTFSPKEPNRDRLTPRHENSRCSLLEALGDLVLQSTENHQWPKGAPETRNVIPRLPVCVVARARSAAGALHPAFRLWANSKRKTPIRTRGEGFRFIAAWAPSAMLDDWCRTSKGSLPPLVAQALAPAMPLLCAD